MQTLSKLFAAALIAAASLSVAQPAQAARTTNGVELNGRFTNGIELNGRFSNGIELNGIKKNGKGVNGKLLNGVRKNGRNANGTTRNGRSANGVGRNGSDLVARYQPGVRTADSWTNLLTQSIEVHLPAGR